MNIKIIAIMGILIGTSIVAVATFFPFAVRNEFNISIGPSLLTWDDTDASGLSWVSNLTLYPGEVAKETHWLNSSAYADKCNIITGVYLTIMDTGGEPADGIVYEIYLYSDNTTQYPMPFKHITINGSYCSEINNTWSFHVLPHEEIEFLMITTVSSSIIASDDYQYTMELKLK
jgi:hypothetical protein